MAVVAMGHAWHGEAFHEVSPFLSMFTSRVSLPVDWNVKRGLEKVSQRNNGTQVTAGRYPRLAAGNSPRSAGGVGAAGLIVTAPTRLGGSRSRPSPAAAWRNQSRSAFLLRLRYPARHRGLRSRNNPLTLQSNGRHRFLAQREKGQADGVDPMARFRGHGPRHGGLRTTNNSPREVTLRSRSELVGLPGVEPVLFYQVDDGTGVPGVIKLVKGGFGILINF